MRSKTLSIPLTVASLVFLSGCGSNVAIEVPELDMVVMAPQGYTVETLVEDGFEIYRIFDGETPVADFEEHEGYEFEMSELSTPERIKGVLDSWGYSYDVLDEQQGEYGATVSYETSDSYGVLGGLEYEGTKVVCQAAPVENGDVGRVFEICKNAIPKATYSDTEVK